MCSRVGVTALPLTVMALPSRLYELLKFVCRKITPPVAELLFHIGSPCQNIPAFRISPFGGLIAVLPN